MNAHVILNDRQKPQLLKTLVNSPTTAQSITDVKRRKSINDDTTMSQSSTQQTQLNNNNINTDEQKKKRPKPQLISEMTLKTTPTTTTTSPPTPSTPSSSSSSQETSLVVANTSHSSSSSSSTTTKIAVPLSIYDRIVKSPNNASLNPMIAGRLPLTAAVSSGIIKSQPSSPSQLVVKKVYSSHQSPVVVPFLNQSLDQSRIRAAMLAASNTNIANSNDTLRTVSQNNNNNNVSHSKQNNTKINHPLIS